MLYRNIATGAVIDSLAVIRGKDWEALAPGPVCGAREPVSEQEANAISEAEEAQEADAISEAEEAQEADAISEAEEVEEKPTRRKRSK